MKDTKKILRNRQNTFLSGLSPDELNREVESISRHLLDFVSAYPEPFSLFCFLSTPLEFPTWSLLEDIHRMKKDQKIYVPRVISSVRHGAKMDFFPLHFNDGVIDKNYMDQNNWGIWQPLPDKDEAKVLEKEETGLIILPGLLFDLKGTRLGYGGGYYDRYLERLAGKTVLISPVRSISLSPVPLPQEAHDVKLNYLALDDGIYSIG